jgi:signal transduction histidine kinase
MLSSIVSSCSYFSQQVIYRFVDRQRLGQVLANLLSNAAKFSPEGSAVEVAVASKNGYVQVSVSDRTCIPQAFRQRIFSKFSAWMQPIRGRRVVPGWAGHQQATD